MVIALFDQIGIELKRICVMRSHAVRTCFTDAPGRILFYDLSLTNSSEEISQKQQNNCPKINIPFGGVLRGPETL